MDTKNHTDLNDYSVKVKYCPGMRRNVIIKIDNVKHAEICMDRFFCKGQYGCIHDYYDV